MLSLTLPILSGFGQKNTQISERIYASMTNEILTPAPVLRLISFLLFVSPSCLNSHGVQTTPNEEYSHKRQLGRRFFAQIYQFPKDSLFPYNPAQFAILTRAPARPAAPCSNSSVSSRAADQWPDTAAPDTSATSGRVGG